VPQIFSGPGESPPTGQISMWHGLIADIPTGYLLCDGTSGTPDLRASFVRGAPAATEPGTTGGEDTHVLDVSEMPAHTHQFNRYTSGASGGVSGLDNSSPFVSTTTSTGGDGAHENRPVYYEILFMMKT
jgi:hypothetical protein